MAVPQAAPPDVQKALDEDPDAVYLDVRTEVEYERGHPAGALNIPFLFLGGPGVPPEPNERFLELVEVHVGRVTRIFVGCQSGSRSQRAAEVLVSAGFTYVVNMTGGFGGARDRAGNVHAPGWNDCGLPTETGHPAGRCYADLAGDE